MSIVCFVASTVLAALQLRAGSGGAGSAVGGGNVGWWWVVLPWVVSEAAGVVIGLVYAKDECVEPGWWEGGGACAQASAPVGCSPSSEHSHARISPSWHRCCHARALPPPTAPRCRRRNPL